MVRRGWYLFRISLVPLAMCGANPNAPAAKLIMRGLLDYKGLGPTPPLRTTRAPLASSTPPPRIEGRVMHMERPSRGLQNFKVRESTLLKRPPQASPSAARPSHQDEVKT